MSAYVRALSQIEHVAVQLQQRGNGRLNSTMMPREGEPNNMQSRFQALVAHIERSCPKGFRADLSKRLTCSGDAAYITYVVSGVCHLPLHVAEPLQRYLLTGSS